MRTYQLSTASLETVKLVFGFSLKEILPSDGKFYKRSSNPQIHFLKYQDESSKENSKIGR